MSDYRYGTQSDAYAAENDIRQPVPTEKGRKLSLGKKYSGDDGAVNDADDLLQAMGYKSELVRSRSTFQVAFMSFVLASVPYGLATTLYYPIACSGPVGIIWGWLGVSLIILCVAASLGEITSIYPTSGGVYYQTFMLAPPSYRRIASWICGWSFVVGNITITLAVNFATALFLGACINVFETEPGVGIFAGTNWQVYLIFLAITLVCNIVSAFGNRWLPWLDVRFIQSTCRMCYLPRIDFCHLLDFCWCACHHRMRPCHCEKRPPQRQLRLRRIRPVQLRMGTWMVLHGRIASCSLCDFLDRNDHLVSTPLFYLCDYRSYPSSLPKQQSHATLLYSKAVIPLATYAVFTCGKSNQRIVQMLTQV